jgi:KTSC domain
MLRQVLVSSSILSAGYDDEQRQLELEFWQGEVYRYLDVPRSIYDELLGAPSKGDFFNQRIRDAFRSERVR